MIVKVLGEGDPLLLIHGWGMSSKIWIDVANKLSKFYKIYLIDLPGMGQSPKTFDFKMSNIMDEINSINEKKISILGWSLGGQIAISYQKKFSNKVKSLILVSTTPCFINKKNWFYGVEKEIFEEFALQASSNWKHTMKKFFNLQLIGSSKRKEIFSKLEEFFLNDNFVSNKILKNSLNLLLTNDLRKIIEEIDIPLLIISGEKDKVTPVQASYYMAEKNINAVIRVIKGASHIPFMSHRDEFIKYIINFKQSNDK